MPLLPPLVTLEFRRAIVMSGTCTEKLVRRVPHISQKFSPQRPITLTEPIKEGGSTAAGAVEHASLLAPGWSPRCLSGDKPRELPWG